MKFIDPSTRNDTKKRVFWLLFVQAIIICSITVATLCWNKSAAYAIALAGFVSWLPAAYYAVRVFSIGGSSQRYAVMRRFFIGEFEKIVLTIALFTLIFLWFKPERVGIFLISYILCMVIMPFSQLLVGRTLGNAK